MFNSLKGIVTRKFGNTIFLDVNGIEWDLFATSSTVESVGEIGSEARIFTWLYMREDSARFYGFATEEERDVFLDLLKVEGVGAKGAVKILSNISVSRFITALDEGNTEALEAVSGIGKRTAAKIMLKLKGKLTLDDSAKSTSNSEKSEFQDVINSLVEMGYDKRDVQDVVQKILGELLHNEDFTSKSQTGKEEMIFRKALVDLA